MDHCSRKISKSLERGYYRSSERQKLAGGHQFRNVKSGPELYRISDYREMLPE